uniref:WGS project CBMD000000000 data, contig CS3427_c000724 n=1 Tax=Fusarium pseudograminearum CS3427 TaxID=1318457 RepID=A0A096PCP1_FUSPS|nr:unnamed protein product [Fusarium pseudograminearum CS3427]
MAAVGDVNTLAKDLWHQVYSCMFGWHVMRAKPAMSTSGKARLFFAYWAFVFLDNLAIFVGHLAIFVEYLFDAHSSKDVAAREYDGSMVLTRSRVDLVLVLKNCSEVPAD